MVNSPNSNKAMAIMVKVTITTSPDAIVRNRMVRATTASPGIMKTAMVILLPIVK